MRGTERVARWLAAAALLGTLALVWPSWGVERVGASDESEQDVDEPVEVSWEEWRDRVQRTTRKDDTTALRASKLRSLADGLVIRRRGRVLDSKELDARPRRMLEVRVAALHTGEQVWSFELLGDDMKEATKWSRWDRLSWLNRAQVDTGGRLTYQPLFRGLDDVHHSPSPGPEFPEPDLPLKRRGALNGWLLRYAKLDEDGRRSALWRRYEYGAAYIWPVGGSVVAVGRERADEVEIELDEEVRVWNRTERRVWPKGITESPVRVRVADPEAMHALTVGVVVDVHVRFDGYQTREEFRERDGALPIRFSVGAIELE